MVTNGVLIVPFMELKPNWQRASKRRQSLNRTFYGIETGKQMQGTCRPCRLNRTFYGIETRLDKSVVPCIDSLNRTFYGIETHK